ncbi:MAG: M1 family metallopeptidase [Chthoniobacteraceae bacterium]
MFRALLLFIFTATALGGERYSFERTPGRLPKNVLPKVYRIRIEPDIEHAAFTGSVEIDVEVREPVRAFTLNALGLTICSATLDKNGALSAETDAEKQFLTLTPRGEIAKGAHTLRIEFSGAMTEQPQGIFLTRFQLPDGKWSKAVVTQMEPSDARRMFPCWDEPVFRAAFQLTAIVPAEHTGLFNMPAKSERALDGGRKEITFGTTPPMASYLVAFSSGVLDVEESEIAGTKLRVLATTGKRDRMKLAIDATKSVLPFYNDYFGTQYPLPKLDQIAFPSVAASGMENWGAIVYSDTALLFDPAVGSQANRERVFDVVAHEIAHQWFGDLVTMAWWDNLWLNEGFASWMATKAADHFNPSWKKWLRAANSAEAAMRLDARTTTHPIEQPTIAESQVNDAFDEITYQKGQAVLRMIESWLGPEKFRDGMRLYFSRHANGSTTTADLWQALEDSSGEKVRAMAAGWTEQPGFPLVRARSVGHGEIELSQERFTVHQKNAAALTWRIPVIVGDLGSSEKRTVLLGPEPLRVRAALPVRVNAGRAGYFRVEYTGDAWTRLRARITELPEEDRLGILQDQWALVQAGRAPLSRWLDLATVLRDDPSPTVGAEITGVIGFLNHAFRGTGECAALQNRARALLAPRLAHLGWDAKSPEEPAAANHRAGLIRLLGQMDEPAVRTEARRRFEAFMTRPESLAGDLRGAVLTLAGQDADSATWDRIHELAKRTTDTEQKDLLYSALASVRDGALCDRTLALALGDELPARQAAGMVRRVASGGEQPERAWHFAKANLPALLARVSEFESNRIVPHIFANFTDEKRAAELETFAEENLPPRASRAVALATDEIRFQSEFRTRALREAAAWIAGPDEAAAGK